MFIFETRFEYYGMYHLSLDVYKFLVEIILIILNLILSLFSNFVYDCFH